MVSQLAPLKLRERNKSKRKHRRRQTSFYEKEGQQSRKSDRRGDPGVNGSIRANTTLPKLNVASSAPSQSTL
jgi:hypothetical protein